VDETQLSEKYGVGAGIAPVGALVGSLGPGPAAPRKRRGCL